MTEYLDTWRKSRQERGVMVSRLKTQFMDFTFMPDKDTGRVAHFKYFGMSIEEECDMETEITKRVGADWILVSNAVEYSVTEGCSTGNHKAR